MSNLKSMINLQIDEVRMAMNMGEPQLIATRLGTLNTLMKSFIIKYQTRSSKLDAIEKRMLENYTKALDDFNTGRRMRISRPEQAYYRIEQYNMLFEILTEYAVYEKILGFDELSKTEEVWKK